MKKLTLVAFSILFMIVKADCQITKGNWLFGGNINFSSNKSTSDLGGYTATTIDVAGNAGYFFMDKLAAGLRPNLFLKKSSLTILISPLTVPL